MRTRASEHQSTKLWGSRFKKKMDAGFERFSSSFKWDRRLVPYDLKIDAAHVKALHRCGIFSSGEAKKLSVAIDRLQKKFLTGAFSASGNAEDVHSAIQNELKSRAGGIADKLHTARSRNDLVAQSTRLYCKEHAMRILSLLGALQKAIVEKADSAQDVFVPGMTHLKPAQVLSQAHIFLAYVEMLDRPKHLFETTKKLSDVCVLGSGALAGVTFALDQKQLARDLHLSGITGNSYDVSGDRDFVLHMLSSLFFAGLSLSRMAEDLMLGQLQPVGLVEADEAFCTGSSMMPQKKNADFLELARGAAGIFAGNFMAMAATLKGLPTSYNRDLQWDKKYLFDSVETCEELLEIFTRFFKTLKINKARAKELLGDDALYATDLADRLVRKGVPFKTAHEQTGRIVSFAEAKGVPISKIGLDLLKQMAPKLDADVYEIFDARHSVQMKKTQGSTHPAEIKRQLKRWKKLLC